MTGPRTRILHQQASGQKKTQPTNLFKPKPCTHTDQHTYPIQTQQGPYHQHLQSGQHNNHTEVQMSVTSQKATQSWLERKTKQHMQLDCQISCGCCVPYFSTLKKHYLLLALSITERYEIVNIQSQFTDSPYVSVCTVVLRLFLLFQIYIYFVLFF